MRLDVYKADAVLYAGDLTGKAMVPIVAVGDRYEATLLGQRRVARTAEELAALERDVTSLGYYAFRTTKQEVDALGGDQAKLDALSSTEIRSRVTQWLDLAAERLDGNAFPLVLIPGNDDPYDIDESLAASQCCVNADGAVVDIPGGLQVIGLGKSSPTRWDTPREVHEDAFREDLLAHRSGRRSTADAIVGNDCGWWRTVTLNLERIMVLASTNEPALVPEGGNYQAVEQLDA